MISNFADNNYIDIDSITVLRWFDEKEIGIVVVDGEKISVNREEFDVIEKAFIQTYKTSLYDKDMKKGGF